MREIIYYLLLGEQGARLRRIAVLGGDLQRIARAINLLRTARTIAGRSGRPRAWNERFEPASSIQSDHRHESAPVSKATSAARGPPFDAGRAARRGQRGRAGRLQRRGHFNREYKSLFGLPPMRDVERLRETTVASTF